MSNKSRADKYRTDSAVALGQVENALSYLSIADLAQARKTGIIPLPYSGDSLDSGSPPVPFSNPDGVVASNGTYTAIYGATY